jgi:hypothetical protein
MNLTFKGFLRGYCRELTGSDTDSLSRLFAKVQTTAPAAAEAVMVFAALQDKAGYLCRLASGTEFSPSYEGFRAQLSKYGTLEACLQAENTGERYRKVWQAWLAKRDAIVADRRVIALMRERTLEALQTTGVKSAYALCKELRLNKGNFYAYLNKGDATKVSRATARKIMQAAQAACAGQ